jgi:hypothetical protein
MFYTWKQYSIRVGMYSYICITVQVCIREEDLILVVFLSLESSRPLNLKYKDDISCDSSIFFASDSVGERELTCLPCFLLPLLPTAVVAVALQI